MKNSINLLLLLLMYSSANAQILKSSILNLNPGGKVYDVAYDESHNVYFIVGDFTTVNGFPRKNFAVIQGSTMNLLGINPITSMDGVIRSVEFIKSHKYVYLPTGVDYVDTVYSVYLGGNFQTVNGQSKSFLARVSSTWTGQTATLSPYALDSYDMYIDPVPSPTLDDGIFDMTTDLSINNQATQSLSLVGNFTISTGASAPHYSFLNNDDDLYNFARLTHTLTNPEFLNYVLEVPLSSSITDQNSPTFNDISYTYDGLILSENSPASAAHARVYALGASNGQGSVVSTYSNVQNNNASGRESTVWIKPNGDTTMWVERINNNTVTHESMDEFAAAIDNQSVRDLVTYNGDLYNTVPNTSTSLANLGKTSTFTQFIAETNLSSFDNAAFQKKLHCQQDRLFLSDAGLTSVNGSPRIGLAIFCLEPLDSEPFTSSDAMVCHSEIHTYSIDEVIHADGYRWTFNGSGALYRITSSGNTWQPLSTIYLSTATANSIDIQFPAGSTSGSLTVAPYSVCNSAADYQYSQGQSLFITVNALPDISLSPNYTLDCYADSVLMVAQSTMLGVDYSWTYPTSAAATLNDTIIVTQGTNFSDSSFYVVVVTNPISGCFSEDSTYFASDLVAAPISQSAITTNPVVFTCSTDSMAIQSNISGATVTWTSPTEVGTFSDPYWITDTTFPSGDLTVYATYLSNGCSTQANWGGIVVDQVQATGQLIGYAAIGGSTVDTIDCSNPTLSLQCGVTAAFAANSTAQWLDASGGTPTGSDSLNLSEADATGLSPLLTKTFFFQTTNNDNGCTAEFGVVVRFDFVQPSVNALADASINCSQSDATLTHPINGNSWEEEGWLDQSGGQTFSNSITGGVGDYYYHVQSTLNGCMNTDTVSVFQTQDLLLDMLDDTTVCMDQLVTISPTIIGNTETPTYVWSTGSTTAIGSASGDVDFELSVIVTTPSGCTGYDTTLILINDSIQADILALVGCDDGNLQVSNVTGGAGSYEYSLDGSPWSTTTSFTNLIFGDYTVSIQDSLGCAFDFDVNLDGTVAPAIEMVFAVSTYNETGDTVILVNITPFTGLDSISWEVPAIADVILENDSLCELSIPIAGWFDVTLHGYSGGNCQYSYTKPVYFGLDAPTFDSLYVTNGIVNDSIAPNPTNGAFDVMIEFGVTQNYTIIITNNLGQPIPNMLVSSQGQNVQHQFTFPSGTPTGIYRVHIIADYDAKQESILLTQ